MMCLNTSGRLTSDFSSAFNRLPDSSERVDETWRFLPDMALSTLPYCKPISGSMRRGSKTLENQPLIDEREWRYVPKVPDGMPLFMDSRDSRPKVSLRIPFREAADDGEAGFHCVVDHMATMMPLPRASACMNSCSRHEYELMLPTSAPGLTVDHALHSLRPFVFRLYGVQWHSRCPLHSRRHAFPAMREAVLSPITNATAEEALIRLLNSALRSRARQSGSGETLPLWATTRHQRRTCVSILNTMGVLRSLETPCAILNARIGIFEHGCG